MLCFSAGDCQWRSADTLGNRNMTYDLKKSLKEPMHRILAIALLALFLAAPRPGSAQATGTISGTVRDSSGAVVPGAKITATNEGTNLTRSVEADDAGQYIVPQLPVGAYQVRVDKAGFASFAQNGISLQANTTVQVDAV